MIEFNFWEWIVVGIGGFILICMVLAEWILGQVRCCGTCDQGRRCRCQVKQDE